MEDETPFIPNISEAYTKATSDLVNKMVKSKIRGYSFDYIIYDEAQYISDEDWQKIMGEK